MLLPHKNDFSASFIVFLVALPLCLGISLASDAPLESGLIAGIVGGIVVGLISGSRLGVSGPAAGLAVIVAASIIEAGSFEKFLVAGIIAGVFQLIFGFIKLGKIKEFVPQYVITGMLAGIGVLLLYKQIPYIMENTIVDGKADFSYLTPSFHMPSIVMGIIAILVLANGALWKKIPVLGALPVHLPLAIACAIFAIYGMESLGANEISNPILPDGNILAWVKFPDFSALTDISIYLIGLKIAIVASLESLLSLEATDKLSGGKPSPANRELIAQGVGNIVSSLIGGLPVTQVIVRSSANHQSNAQTKYSAIFHGIILLAVMLAFPFLAKVLPLPFLAAILVLTGFKLASPQVWNKQLKAGAITFIGFLITISGVVLIDLLSGVIMGMAFSILVGLKSIKSPFNKKEKAGKSILEPNGEFGLFHQLAIQKKKDSNLIIELEDHEKEFYGSWLEKKGVEVVSN